MSVAPNPPGWWPLRRPLRLRWHLVGLSVGVLLPVVIFAAVLLSRLAAEQREQEEHRLVESARILAGALDREMAATLRTLQALGQSERLERGDLAAFHAEAARVIATQPEWLSIRLLAPDGTVLVDTARPWGTPLGKAIERSSLSAVVNGREPVIGALTLGEETWAFPLRIPILRRGEVRYVLTAVMTAAGIAEIVGRGGEAEWSRTVVDDRGLVVARSRDPARFVGKAATPSFTALIRSRAEGAARERSLEGADTFVGFSRAALSGWTVAVVVTADQVASPARRSVLAVVAFGLAVLVLSGGAAFAIALRLSRSIEATAADAAALARGERPTARRSRVAEVTHLRDALVRAADLLAARERERDDHLAHAEAARAQAETANRAKDEFLAMLGHELRNPLSPIVTALELLRLRGEGDTREHAIIERQVRHVVRLVDDLLDVARIARGKIALATGRVELSAVVARAVEMTSPAFEARAHRLDVDVPATGLAVDGDADRLAQVVSNLLTNAARYTPPRGRVSVRADARGDEVVLEVKDSGQGIPPELLARVFDLFVQGRRDPDRQEGGLGLGLTLVRSLVEAHGGRVEARSEGAGLGSTFVVTLPRAAAAGSAAAGLPRRGALRTAARRARVLVVDDNEDAAHLLTDLLEGAGHEVVAVHDGPAALDALRRFSPTVAILDIGLPVMDGYELAERIRDERGEAAPALVALTGYGQGVDRERSRAAGFDRHLVKPADPDAILELVEALAAGSAAAAARPGAPGADALRGA